MNVLDPVTALAIFCGWTLVACAVGCLVGKVIKLGTRVERPYDQEHDERDAQRSRSDVRNGMGGAA